MYAKGLCTMPEPAEQPPPHAASNVSTTEDALYSPFLRQRKPVRRSISERVPPAEKQRLRRQASAEQTEQELSTGITLRRSNSIGPALPAGKARLKKQSSVRFSEALEGVLHPSLSSQLQS